MDFRSEFIKLVCDSFNRLGLVYVIQDPETDVYFESSSKIEMPRIESAPTINSTPAITVPEKPAAREKHFYLKKYSIKEWINAVKKSGTPDASREIICDNELEARGLRNSYGNWVRLYEKNARYVTRYEVRKNKHILTVILSFPQFRKNLVNSSKIKAPSPYKVTNESIAANEH
jgi:hypothetical protein